ncbi:MAG: bifunctional diaminohydroxyphosphoribosylaminopyrimidine deaminase/5-amino-6-(5-phosphoribosylamino)uracil reductase RibD [Acidimicrobiia bacterium]
MTRPTDDELMAEALRCAVAARAATPPWPQVGCVIVRDGEVVGRGATGIRPTGDHAEVAALRAAGDLARGATAYTTLEPCNHHGNTPPCTEALIAAGVARVVTAVVDPDPKVAGTGHARLRAAGVAVEIGTGTGPVTEFLRAYLHQRRTGRAFALLKTAMSLDGRTAAADGTSQWITSEESRRDVHRLRAESHAIVVGPATALADRPSLTARGVELGPWGQPRRVLLDAKGRVPVEGPLADPTLAPTTVYTTSRMPDPTRAAWDAAGADVRLVDAGPKGDGVDLGAVLHDLATEYHAFQALVEGGGKLHGAFVAEGRADRLVTYVAPVILGERGRAVLDHAGPDTLAAADRGWSVADVTPIGPDVRITYARPAARGIDELEPKVA